MSSYSERIKNRRSSSGKTKQVTTANTYENYLASYKRRGKRGSGFQPLTRDEWEARESRGIIRGCSGAKRGVGEVAATSSVDVPQPIIDRSQIANLDPRDAIPGTGPKGNEVGSDADTNTPGLQGPGGITDTPEINTGTKIETIVDKTETKEPYSVFDDPRFMSARERAQKRIKDLGERRRHMRDYAEDHGITPKEARLIHSGGNEITIG